MPCADRSSEQGVDLMIKFKQKGDFRKTTKYFNNAKEIFKTDDLTKYGKMGVEALSMSTPRDTGKTAESWYYSIENQNGKVIIAFHNTNVVDNVSIAVVLQYGHGTRNGGWVEGRDYINPAIRPVFDEIANKAWKEATTE